MDQVQSDSAAVRAQLTAIQTATTAAFAALDRLDADYIAPPPPPPPPPSGPVPLTTWQTNPATNAPLSWTVRTK